MLCLRKLPILTLFALLPLSSAVAQSSVVNWGGEMVTTSTDLNRAGASQLLQTGVNNNPASRDNRLIVTTDALSNDSNIGVPFSSTVQFNPTSGYTGQRFYGGAVKSAILSTNPPGFNELRIRNSGTTDDLDVRIQDNTTQQSLWFAMFFKKEDFVAGGNLGSNLVKFGPSSSLTVSFTSSTSTQITNFGELRWLVFSEGQWWISARNSAGKPNIMANNDPSSSFGIGNNLVFTDTFASGALDYWAPYNVTDTTAASGLSTMNFEPSYTTPAKPSFDIAPGSNPFFAKTFNSIDAIGLYIEDDQYDTNVIQFRIGGINFNMQVSVIPEPTILGLSGLGLAGLIWYRRHKKQKALLAESDAELAEMV